MEQDFDRQAFIAQPQPPKRPASGGGLILILFVIVLGVAAGAYQFLSPQGGLASATHDSELAQVMQRLEEIEKRLGRFEKQRKTAPAEPANPPATAATTPSAPRPESAPAPGNSPRFAITGTVPADSGRSLSELKDEVGTLRGGLGANQEAWQASTDRISDVVGDLGDQRRSLEEHRRNLQELQSRLDRPRQPYRLHKTMGRIQVGSVGLKLLGTNPEKQMYSLQVLVDDKRVELRSRSLYEPVYLYPRGSSLPLELVVSEIRKNEVAGYLALPAPRR